MLQPLAEELGIALKHSNRLPVLDEMKEEMLRFTGQPKSTTHLPHGKGFPVLTMAVELRPLPPILVPAIPDQLEQVA